MPYFISFKKRGKIKPFYMLLIKYSRIEKILKVVILKYYIIPCRKFRKYRRYEKLLKIIHTFPTRGRFDFLTHFFRPYSVMFHIVDDICKEFCFFYSLHTCKHFLTSLKLLYKYTFHWLCNKELKNFNPNHQKSLRKKVTSLLLKAHKKNISQSQAK